MRRRGTRSSARAPRGLETWPSMCWGLLQVKSLIQSSVDGYNVCIFAYGQTGSGKTFTINGPDSNPGIVPRSLEELYRLVGAATGKAAISLKVYMLELYQDKLIDLLYNVRPACALPGSRPGCRILRLVLSGGSLRRQGGAPCFGG